MRLAASHVAGDTWGSAARSTILSEPRFIETGRLRMAYRRQGMEGGIPLLLLHGSFASSRWWQPVLELLPDEFDAIAPDLRGCGATEKPASGYSIESQAEDIALLVDALKLRGFCLVAHSSASAIAIEYLLRTPEIAHSLLLIAPPPLTGVVTPPEGLLALEQMRVDAELLVEAMALLAPQTALAGEELFASIVEDAQGMAPAAFTANASALGEWNRSADARLLTLPTLIVWGDQDPIVSRADVTRLLVSLPGALNLDVLHGVGHSPMLDAPLELAERIVDFATDDLDLRPALDLDQHPVLTDESKLETTERP